MIKYLRILQSIFLLLVEFVEFYYKQLWGFMHTHPETDFLKKYKSDLISVQRLPAISIKTSTLLRFRVHVSRTAAPVLHATFQFELSINASNSDVRKLHLLAYEVWTDIGTNCTVSKRLKPISG